MCKSGGLSYRSDPRVQNHLFELHGCCLSNAMLTDRDNTLDFMTSRVVLRLLSVLLLLVSLAWFGGRQSLMPHEWITGPRGWSCWGVAWIAFIGGAWAWALSSGSGSREAEGD